ncbi:MAG TPA: DUF2905 domain-containing protein [Syntrophales bacterium]|nr:DUF2905 domain-containing protein [Syntrophales bacterium]HOM07106.1 DUF2905 domain-containing protein [Syntrophales bacterium]HOO00379.1 DUF2905 domain-containing protein [Syntrophales bacterium]HPC00450.1 DUF2905 domain-containing protein [Syntrophales bacterium]HPQ05533.1 DUF2905 domain-containing protein [Syntrophales bacterium]
MNDLYGLGKILLFIGLLTAGLGLVLLLAGKIPWLGRLPGDIYFRGERFTFYFPLATSLVISVVLSLLLWFIGRK